MVDPKEKWISRQREERKYRKIKQIIYILIYGVLHFYGLLLRVNQASFYLVARGG
jgi:hypothetical protein